jgi:vitamin B12 transporter
MNRFFSSVFSLLFIATNLNVVAQTIVEIEEVEVSSRRAPVEFSKAARNVILLTEEDIKNSSATNLNEVLEFVAGVDVRQRGQQGVQADLSIRGSSFEQVLVLINGIKMTDPQTGHHAMNLPISLLDIERVEILHGGAARIYGPGAFAGAINIITKTPKTTEATIEILAGEYGLRQIGVSAAIVQEKMNHRVSFQQQESEGFVRNTDYRSSSIFWESKIKVENFSLGFNLGQNSKAFGAQNFYTARFPDQFEETRTQFASVVGEYKNKRLEVKIQAYARKHNDRFELFREGESFYRRLPQGGFANNKGDTVVWYSNHNYHQTNVCGAEFAANYTSRWGKTSLGYDYRSEEVISNNLGDSLSSAKQVVNEVPTAMYYLGAFRDNHSIYLEHNVTTEKLSVSAGVLFNSNSQFGDGYYPGIDMAYQLDSAWRLYGSVNKSFRFPSFTDLYYNLGGALGSDQLETEESMNYELGLKCNITAGFGHVALFRREGTDLIDWVRLSGSAITQATNLTNITIDGAEVDYYFFPALIGSSLNFLKQVKFSYSYMTSRNKSSGFESNYVLDFLRHKADMGLKIKLAKQFYLNWNTSYQERRGEYADADGIEQQFDPVLLSDIKLSTEQKSLNVFVQASNVFNQEFVDLGNVQNPGRWFSVGLKYNVKASK